MPIVNRKLSTLKNLQGYAGKVFESDGPNRSPEIDHANEFIGVPLGSSYCVSIAKWARALTYRDQFPEFDLTSGVGFKAFCLKVRPIIAKEVGLIASCTAQMDWAKERGVWKPMSDIMAGRYMPQPGDSVIYQFNLHPDPGEDVERHFGTIESWSGSTFVTIEGNTRPEPSDQSNDAAHGGVFRKHRHVNPCVLGVVNIPA